MSPGALVLSIYCSMFEEDPDLVGEVPMYESPQAVYESPQAVARREGPTASLRDGELAVALASEGNWTRVLTVSGADGWVLKNDLKLA